MFEIKTNTEKENEVSYRHTISTFFSPIYIDPNSEEFSAPTECVAEIMWPAAN